MREKRAKQIAAVYENSIPALNNIFSSSKHVLLINFALMRKPIEFYRMRRSGSGCRWVPALLMMLLTLHFRKRKCEGQIQSNLLDFVSSRFFSARQWVARLRSKRLFQSLLVCHLTSHVWSIVMVGAATAASKEKEQQQEQQRLRDRMKEELEKQVLSEMYC